MADVPGGQRYGIFFLLTNRHKPAIPNSVQIIHRIGTAASPVCGIFLITVRTAAPLVTDVLLKSVTTQRYCVLFISSVTFSSVRVSEVAPSISFQPPFPSETCHWKE